MSRSNFSKVLRNQKITVLAVVTTAQVYYIANLPVLYYYTRKQDRLFRGVYRLPELGRRLRRQLFASHRRTKPH
jgi:hypothetical protein